MTKAFKVVETFCTPNSETHDGEALVKGMILVYAVHVKNLLEEVRHSDEILRLVREKVRV